MTQVDSYEVLNNAFIRVYRSFGHYLDSASPKFDVGQDVLPAIIEQLKDDANRLGQVLNDKRGFVETGSYPHTFSDSHFLNISRLLDGWVEDQRQLLAGLEADRQLLPADFEDLALLDEVIDHVRGQLDTLENLNSDKTLCPK